MKLSKIIIWLTILTIPCCQTKPHIANKTHKSHKQENEISYDEVKAELKKQKKSLVYMDITEEGIAQDMVFSNLLRLFPYWMGTPWNFYGTSEIPKQGNVACGYFVTTLLRDAGLKINRVHLAQQASSEIIKSVCDKKQIHSFSNTTSSNKDFFKFIKNQGKAIYILGLDFHTGFLYNDGQKIHFIQSKYYDERCVVDEDAETSAVILQSKFKQIGRLDNSATCGRLYAEK